jgi:hypothetical protein
MNKKIHIISFLLLLFFICYLCRDKIINLVEPFGNQIVIHRDSSFMPSPSTIPVLSYDSNINSAYIQVGICSDDNRWTNGNKNCRDYSLVGSNCDDVGDDGRSALDMCKVACDNCLNYEEIKIRSESDPERADLDEYPSELDISVLEPTPRGDNNISFTYDGGLYLQYDLTIDDLNIQDEGMIDQLRQSIIVHLNNHPHSEILCGVGGCDPELLNINLP